MSQFSALLQVNGDRGASGLIRALAPSALVSVPDAVLIDIDTPLTLAQYATCP